MVLYFYQLLKYVVKKKTLLLKMVHLYKRGKVKFIFEKEQYILISDMNETFRSPWAYLELQGKYNLGFGKIRTLVVAIFLANKNIWIQSTYQLTAKRVAHESRILSEPYHTIMPWWGWRPVERKTPTRWHEMITKHSNEIKERSNTTSPLGGPGHSSLDDLTDVFSCAERRLFFLESLSPLATDGDGNHRYLIMPKKIYVT